SDAGVHSGAVELFSLRLATLLLRQQLCKAKLCALLKIDTRFVGDRRTIRPLGILLASGSTSEQIGKRAIDIQLSANVGLQDVTRLDEKCFGLIFAIGLTREKNAKFAGCYPA